MKLYKLLFLLFSFTTANSQSNSDFQFNYDFQGKIIASVYSDKYDFIYLSKNQTINFKNDIKSKKNSNELYLFSETSLNNLIHTADFYLVDQSFIKNRFYKKQKVAISSNLQDSVLNNNVIKYHYIKKGSKISDFFYELNNDQYFRIVVSGSSFIDESLFKDHVFIGLNHLVKNNKENPSVFLNIFEAFFPKDFSTQLRLINKLDTISFDNNSYLGSYWVDLHLNEGYFKNVSHKIKSRKKLSIDESKVHNLLEKINEIAINNDIIMFNEFHHYPHTRFNFMHVLKELKNKGFNYLALETLNAPKKFDDIFVNKDSISGYYLEEQNCSLMINYALSLGFKLIAYEEQSQCSSVNNISCRDSIQAENLSKIYSVDPSAKVVVLAGHSHIEKKERGNWKFMRIYLQEILPSKKIFSISQTKFIKSNLNLLDYNFKYPVYYSEDDGQFDSHIISPFYQNYYQWYYEQTELMNQEIVIEDSKKFEIIEIIPFWNEKEMFFPIFKSRKENLQSNRIYIPNGIPYKVVYKDINNKRL